MAEKAREWAIELLSIEHRASSTNKQSAFRNSHQVLVVDWKHPPSLHHAFDNRGLQVSRHRQLGPLHCKSRCPVNQSRPVPVLIKELRVSRTRWPPSPSPLCCLFLRPSQPNTSLFCCVNLPLCTCARSPPSHCSR